MDRRARVASVAHAGVRQARSSKSTLVAVAVLASIALLVAAPTGRGSTEDGSFAERRAAMDPLSRSFLRPNDDIQELPVLSKTAPREVEFENPSGVTLRGTLYDVEGTNRVVVLCLGIRGNHTYLSPYARIVVEAGCDALLFDYQGFGRSDGVASALSLLPDTLAAVDFVRAAGRNPEDVVAFGLSLGSVLALAAAAERGIAGVITEDLWFPAEMLDRIGGNGRRGVLFDLARRAIETIVLPALEPCRNLSRFTGRALLLHGDRDPLLPPRTTLDVFRDRPSGTRVWILPDTGHAPESIETHDLEYRAQVAAFLAETFADAELHGAATTPVARVTIASATARSAIVRVEATGAPYLQITLSDGERFHHVRCRFDSAAVSAEVTIAAPFLATCAVATPIRGARPLPGGSFEEALSPLTSALARFRGLEKLLAPPGASESAVAIAARVERIRAGLPPSAEVDVSVRPRYARALAAFAVAALAKDPAVAADVAESIVPYLPADPADWTTWVEVGSGHFAIGLRDETLSRVLDGMAARRKAAGKHADAARFAALAATAAQADSVAAPSRR